MPAPPMRQSRSLRGNVAAQRADKQSWVVTGYAPVYYQPGDPGTEYEILPGMVERVRQGAAARAVRENQDVRALLNHDANMILGRRSAGTLGLRDTVRGLRFEIVIPDDTLGGRVRGLVARNELTAASFSFTVRRRTFEEMEDLVVVWLEDVDVYDVGPVTFPAYDTKVLTLEPRSRGQMAQAAAREQVERIRRMIRRGAQQDAERLLRDLQAPPRIPRSVIEEARAARAEAERILRQYGRRFPPAAYRQRQSA